MIERIIKTNLTGKHRARMSLAFLFVMAAGFATFSCASNPAGAGETMSAPNKPVGPSSGATGALLTYTMSGAVSSEAHPIEYQMYWGYGAVYSPWRNMAAGGTYATASNAWDTPGAYYIKCRARCAAHNAVISAWSDSLLVTITAAR